MLYIIGLALAFIFGFIYGVGWMKRKIDDAEPLDLKLTEQDLFVPAKETRAEDINVGHPLKDLIFFTYGGLDN